MKTFAQARTELAKYVTPKTQGEVYTLGRMVKLMATLGNPQNQLKVIHVAGTSGKTSTSYYIASLLRAAGAKVGLTVSPHVDEVNERVQIDLMPLPETEFCQALSEFLALVKKTGIFPTYFEVLVAFAYWYFAKVKVDYAVIEVGLGGLLDGTNVVNRSDKICVITDIGLDHVEVLGKNLSEIAAQKAGIIQQANAVFTLKQDTEIIESIKGIAKTKAADLVIVQDFSDTEHDLDALPLFQRRNWWLAFTVFDYIAEGDQLATLTPLQIRDSMQTYIPSRMEIISRGDKTIILDGAHNAQKMQLLAKTLNEKFAGQPIATLLAVKQSRDFIARVDLEPISNLSAAIIVTGFEGQQDFPIKSVEPKIVAEHLKQLGSLEVKVINEPAAAFKASLTRPEPILLVTGSFYLMGYIRPLIQLNND